MVGEKGNEASSLTFSKPRAANITRIVTYKLKYSTKKLGSNQT